MNESKKNVLIYDGHCPFCTAQVERLKSIAGGSLAAESFQERRVLEHIPELSYEDCMKEIKLVTAEGRILGGAHAIFYALSLNPYLRPLRWIYPLPLLKQIIDFLYRLVAQNRYQIRGGRCPLGTCTHHGNLHKKT